MSMKATRPSPSGGEKRAERTVVVAFSHDAPGVCNPQVVRLDDGRPVGRIIVDASGQRIFVRRARAGIHQLRCPRAWSFDAGLLERLAADHVARIEVEDTESGICYTAPLARLLVDGIRLNRGCGEQVALSLHHWACTDPRQPQLPLPDDSGEG